jgi:hypothetical protein
MKLFIFLIKQGNGNNYKKARIAMIPYGALYPCLRINGMKQETLIDAISDILKELLGYSFINFGVGSGRPYAIFDLELLESISIQQNIESSLFGQDWSVLVFGLLDFVDEDEGAYFYGWC